MILINVKLFSLLCLFQKLNKLIKFLKNPLINQISHEVY